ncbi:hypothetical protein NM688_g6206 [Phlebia brevispora]|uniref:Uncharacterized protein n=1 Tax=Phlebia brevispora TaxID=194682 RepID=A0ACC1SIW1_9APHY|nr:hypothetical protein NM688_g6206 [Phlebia brevispora]
MAETSIEPFERVMYAAQKPRREHSKHRAGREQLYVGLGGTVLLDNRVQQDAPRHWRPTEPVASLYKTESGPRMTVQNFTTLGGNASGVKVAKVGHGLMLMTWTPNPVPDEVCFEAIRAGVDVLPPGVKMLINSSEFYSPDFGPANLEMLSRFFEKHPEYADRTVLSVKGGYKPKTPIPDASAENLRRSVTAVNAALRGFKRVDIFQCSRVDHTRQIEDIIRDLAALVKEGLIGNIGVSECSAETLRRANAVHPIAAVEIEVSPWSYEEETRKVIATAQELGIAVVAYAPLGRGFLTGSIKTIDDLPEGDMRRKFTRFNKEEYFKHNMALVDALKALAEKKGVTPATLCIAWVASLGPKVIPIPGSSNAKRVVQNVSAADVQLTEEEAKEIRDIVSSHDIKGGRSRTRSEKRTRRNETQGLESLDPPGSESPDESQLSTLDHHRQPPQKALLALRVQTSTSSTNHHPPRCQHVWNLRRSRLGQAFVRPHAPHRVLEENKTSWTGLVGLLRREADRYGP